MIFPLWHTATHSVSKLPCVQYLKVGSIIKGKEKPILIGCEAVYSMSNGGYHKKIRIFP